MGVRLQLSSLVASPVNNIEKWGEDDIRVWQHQRILTLRCFHFCDENKDKDKAKVKKDTEQTAKHKRIRQTFGTYRNFD